MGLNHAYMLSFLSPARSFSKSCVRTLSQLSFGSIDETFSDRVILVTEEREIETKNVCSIYFNIHDHILVYLC